MAAARPPIPYWRLSSFYFFYFALLGAWLPYWPLYLKSLGFNAAAIGYLGGIVAGTKIIAPNLWGWFADTYGHRMRIIRLGSFAAWLIFLGIFWQQSFWWLALVVAGYSFFWNAVLAQFEVVTLSHLHGRYQHYSRVRLWGSVGFIVAVMALGVVFDFLPIVWLPPILATLLLGIWLSSLAVDEVRDEREGEDRQQSLLAILARPVVPAFFAVCFLMQFAHGPYYTFFSVYLEDNGYPRSMTGALWSLGVIAEVVLFVFMHRLMERYNLRQIMLASLALAVLRWLLIAWFVEHLVVLLLAQCLHAATFGSFHAFAIEMIRRLFGRGNQGQGMALYSALSFGAGGAAGAVVSGLVWDVSASLTFVLAALVCALALAIGWYSGRSEEYRRLAEAGR